MKQNAIGFLCGLIFAVGLGLSGMTNPHKVIGFLDVTGHWDPSLMMVMGGAILAFASGFLWSKKIPKPFFAEVFQIPKKREITPSLVIGATLFGMGWGLAGFCPGPSLTVLFSGSTAPWVFVPFMILGIILYNRYEKIKDSRSGS